MTDEEGGAPAGPIPAAIVGASGYIGQHFARLLADHPWFRVEALVGTSRTDGTRYEDLWQLPEPPPSELAGRRLGARTPAALARLGIRLVFSALPSGHAGPAETALTGRGIDVFTNASDHRMDSDVPLLVPEVNPDHLLRRPPPRPGRGLLVADPNCSAAGLVVALRPLWDLLRPTEVHVATYQALSGAGYPGVPSLAIADNVVPWIPDEEEKIAAESRRMLGTLRGASVVPSRTRIVAQCVRVPVRDGHLEAVTIVAGRADATIGTIRSALAGFDPLASAGLPTAPRPPVVLRREPDRPQPIRDRWAGDPPRARGMAVSVGRLRWDPPILRCFVLSHNAVRGGAGGSVLNAELAAAHGRLGRGNRRAA
ncbi:MAG: aspartate-semialdehyde dehydrogenase [Thermoplasmata archaeon]